jgi:hypothetical protein
VAGYRDVFAAGAGMVSRLEVRVTDRFVASADDGKRFDVVEYTTFRVTHYRSGEVEETRGGATYRLAGGTDVSAEPDGTLKIFPDGPTIRRLDIR